MTETTETEVDLAFEAIKVAFQTEMAKENPDEEAVKMAMLMAGAKFANVTRYFNQLMVEFGFAKSKEERNDILDKLLTGLDLTVESSFDEAVIKAGEALGVNERSAGTSVRMWCKKNEVEFFKKPKSEPGEGRDSFSDKMHKWILDNIDATKEQFIEFFDATASDNKAKFKNRYISLYDFVQKIKTIYQSA